MSLFSGIAKIVAGAALVAGGIGSEILSGGAGSPFAIEFAKLGGLLISAGAGLTLSGIGTLMAGNRQTGTSTATRNPIKPWDICYGRCSVGGTPVFMNQWGTNNQMLDMVIVTSGHKIQSFDMLLFDQSHVAIDASSGTSYQPVQQKGNTAVHINTIVRSNDVVTVSLAANIPAAVPGDRITILDTSGQTTLLNAGLVGTFQVSQVISQVIGNPGSLVFTFLSGGVPISISGHGQATTNWVNYGRNVYVEYLLGTQLLGQTFNGAITGTPWQGNGPIVNLFNPGKAGNSPGASTGSPNPWTSVCSLQGKSAVMLRLQYDAKYFAAGIPQISFRIHGKNDIYDPRLGALTGLGTIAISASGGGYKTGDVLTPASGSGSITVTVVDGSGNPTNWAITNVGSGNAIAANVSFTGGHGSGAKFNITRLTGQFGSNVYTENPALCIADFIANPVYGYGAQYVDPTGSTIAPFNSINIPALIAAANVCDQPVALAIGGTEPRYSCNGRFDLAMRRGDILNNMLTSCAGRLLYVDGQYTIQPGAWAGASTLPVVDLTAIAAGPVRWKPTVSVRDLFNGVKGTYVSPDNKWQNTDFPYYAQDTLHGYFGPSIYGGDINLEADGGQRRWLDIHLPFTISASMAQRIAKIELLRRRNQGTGTFALNLAGYQFVPLDIFNGVCKFLGWTTTGPETLEVSAVRFRADKKENVVVLGTEIDVQQSNSDIYVWSTEEELSPQGYQQGSIPGVSAVEAVCYPWSPGAIAPLAGDAVYVKGATDQATFSMLTSYDVDAAGNVEPVLLIQGYPPINSLDTEIGRPQVSATASATGGSLAGGLYAVAMSAFDSGSANYKNVPYLDVAIVQVPSGTTGSIAVTVVPGPGDDGGDIYMAMQLPPGNPAYATLVNLGEQLAENVFHYQKTLAPNSTSTTLTAFNQSTPGGIDTLFDHFSIVWQQVIHSGPWAQQIQAVTSNTVKIGGAGTTANQYAGYVLSLLAYYDPETPVIVLNMPIASNTASSGSPPEFTLTIGPNSAGVQLPNLTTVLNIADLVTLRSKFTFTSNSMTDPNIANGYFTRGATGVEAGHLAVVLTGVDAGDVQVIQSVTNAAGGGGPFSPSNPAVRFVLGGQWQVTPNPGDIIDIVAAPTAPEYRTPSLMTPNKNTGLANLSGLNVQNLANQVWLFTVRTEDIHNNHCPDFMAPKRELFLFGAAGTLLVNSTSPGYPTVFMPTWYSLVEVVCTTADITIVAPFLSSVGNQVFTVMKLDNTAHQVIIQMQGGDTFADGTTTKTLNAQGNQITFKVNG